MPDDPRPILAVLIDADNTPAQHAPAIFAEINTLGFAALRRVYGDMASPHLKGWSELVPGLGLHPIHSPANTKGKNASDISLVIDAMDQLHSGRFGAFVLVSSDSDFTRLASRIREDGVSVYGIGQKKTPESFRNACNRFIFLENLGVVAADEAAPPARPAPARAPRPAARPDTGEVIPLPASITAPLPPPPPKAKAEPLSEARVLLGRAFDAIDSEGDWVGLGALGQYLIRADPGFDPRTYGHKKLSDLVKSLAIFETRTDGTNQMLVRRKD
jgi:hypothetical protein